MSKQNMSKLAKSGKAWKPSHLFLRSIEEHATILRKRAGIGPLDPLDPRVLAPKFGVILVKLEDLTNLSPEDYTHLCNVDAKVWSGMGVPLPSGEVLVILHPKQTKERATVTIMEEVAHAYLNHQPSELSQQSNGLTKRQYNEEIEREAYWTAAATLLPSVVVARAVWLGKSVEVLAAEYGVSFELAEFRIKTLNLWPAYKLATS